MKKLSEFGFDVYSQSGEDGIVAKIFSLIGTRSKVCIEFGAWDGFHQSNTANLWAKQDWHGVLIESDAARFLQLVENTKGRNCRCVQARVENTGPNTLERILKRESIDGPVDLLSIDIDGDDYYILQSLETLRPRVILCEYNPTIPPHMELVASPGNYFGCSSLSLVKLAEAKGYRLAAVTNSNCCFVLAEEFGPLAEFETSLPAIAVTKNLTYFITGYSGDDLLSREPTYGCTGPSAQEFTHGAPHRFPSAAAGGSERKRSGVKQKLQKSARKWFGDRRFQRAAREAKELHAEWEKDFSPLAGKFLHPLWQKARPAFLDLIQSGVPEDFLSNSEVAHQFCRGGFGPPQEHELKYLKGRPPELWNLVKRYRESKVGGPGMECADLQISANSLGMLYYFIRIAEQTDLASLHTIAEFGGGYACLCRVFLELLPRRPTYIIIDLPEMLALQYLFLKAGPEDYKVAAHSPTAPLRIESGAVNLVPVQMTNRLSASPDLFISTFALSETPAKLQEEVARGGFWGTRSLYLVGQEVDTPFWEKLKLVSPRALHLGAREWFADVRLQPYHYASAWELFATERRVAAKP